MKYGKCDIDEKECQQNGKEVVSGRSVLVWDKRVAILSSMGQPSKEHITLRRPGLFAAGRAN